MLAQALDHLVRGVVDHPDDVVVELVPQGRNRLLEVQVHHDDVGKVIGRNGRTVKALRQVMGSVGGRGIRVEILDDVLGDGVEDTGESTGNPTAVGSE
ncbi:MAG: RNA-binding protein [Acidimicrobiales bacterium]|nr:MAG: RNA-binding protein [Acidimicrobiales bacterium]